MFHTNQIFIKNLFKNDKTLNLYLTENNLYYLVMHVKLSSLFYSTQLTDIFAYDYPYNTGNNNPESSPISTLNNNVIVYNFHSIQNQQRFFIFSLNHIKKNYKKNSIN